MATRKSPASAEKKTTTRKTPTHKAVAAPAVEKHMPTYHEIAALAEHYWMERGRPFGSPEVDWLRAEAILRS